MNKERSQVRSAAFQALILPSIVVVLGLQSLRGFIPGLSWYLRDTVGIGTLSLLPYAFGTFILGFLAIFVSKLFNARLTLWISAGGLAVLRLIEQLVIDPAVDLWLGIASVGLFLIFMPLFISWTRAEAEPFPLRWFQGLILGLSADVAIRALFGMRDPGTVRGWVPVVVILILSLVVLRSLWQESKSESRRFREGRGKSVALLLAQGPYFVLQLFYLQNSGWLEEVSGLSYPLGFLIISLGYLASAAGLALAEARPRSLHPSLTIGSGFLLIYGVYYANQLGIGALVLILAGQFTLGWGLGGIAKANLDGKKNTVWRTTLAVTGGMVLFLILAFAFYVTQDIALPIDKASFPALAAGAAALLVIWGSVQAWKGPKRPWDWTGPLFAGLLVLIPIIFWCFWGTGPEGKAPAGFPVQVMSYNIHSAFNVAGGQDLEAIASVIEESGAEIIGLQEVSRTRLMDGGADMPTWLAQVDWEWKWSLWGPKNRSGAMPSYLAILSWTAVSRLCPGKDP